MTTYVAGRELDALVGEKVFGLKVEWLPAPEHPHHHGKNVPIEPQTGSYPPNGEGPWCAMYWVIPHYSTDIGAAWEVVERVADGHVGTYDAMEVLLSYGPERCHVKIYDSSPGGYVGPAGEDIPQAPGVGLWASSAPLAICLAALQAVEATP